MKIKRRTQYKVHRDNGDEEWLIKLGVNIYYGICCQYPLKLLMTVFRAANHWSISANKNMAINNTVNVYVLKPHPKKYSPRKTRRVEAFSSYAKYNYMISNGAKD